MNKLAASLVFMALASSAQAQIVTSKLWPYLDEACLPNTTDANGWCPKTINGASTPSGYPKHTNFHKLQDQTGLRCSFAGDFITGAQAVVIEVSLVIDDGSKWGIGVGFTEFANSWIATPWTITFIKDAQGNPMPAGDHQVSIWLGTQGGPVLFYPQYAVLECFEEQLGIQQ